MQELLEIYKLLQSYNVPSFICNAVVFIGSLILWNIKLSPIINKYIYKRKLTVQSSTDAIIKDAMSEYRELMICDRLAIFEFHNNIHSLSGKSFIKFTCTYESCRLGVPHYNLNRKDVQLSSHREILDVVTKNCDLIVRKSDLPNKSSEMNQCFQEGGMTNLMIVPINNKGFLVGFIGVEFTRDIDLTDQDAWNIIHKAHELAGKISNKIEYGK